MPVGRPKNKGGRRKPASVMLTSKELALAKNAAKAQDLPLSQWIAMLIRGHFAGEGRRA